MIRRLAKLDDLAAEIVDGRDQPGIIHQRFALSAAIDPARSHADEFGALFAHACPTAAEIATTRVIVEGPADRQICQRPGRMGWEVLR